MTGSSLRFSVRGRTDARAAALEISRKDARLNAAMRRATASGTRILGRAVEGLVVSRTTMGRGVAARIVNVRMVPGTGAVARGIVSFERPPDRIYPRRKRALAFTVGNRRIVRRSVRGSRPYALIPRAALAEGTVRVIGDNYQREVEKAL